MKRGKGRGGGGGERDDEEISGIHPNRMRMDINSRIRCMILIINHLLILRCTITRLVERERGMEGGEGRAKGEGRWMDDIQDDRPEMLTEEDEDEDAIEARKLGTNSNNGITMS